MPKQVLPTIEDFKKIETALKELGFREIGSNEVKKDFYRKSLTAPRPRTGKEVMFQYHSDGLSVIVCTTWVRDANEARESDSGWVLIKDGDDKVWYNPRIHRTKNFVTNLLFHAGYAMERVLARPICPECKQSMKIVEGKTLHSRYWACRNRREHASKKQHTASWDQGLRPSLIRKRIKIRKERARQKARQRKKDLERGVQSVPSRISRKAWEKSSRSKRTRKQVTIH